MTSSISRILWITLAAALCVLGAVLVLLQTDFVRGWVLQEAVEALEERQGLILEVGELKGKLPFTLTGYKVSVADKDGVWITADKVHLRASPWSLFQRRISITSARLEGVVWHRPADFKEADPKESQWQLGISDVEVVGWTLGQELIDKIPDNLNVPAASPNLYARGTLSSRFGRHSMKFELTVYDVNNPDARTVLTVESDRDFDDYHRIRARLEESNDGVVATVLNLPAAPAFSLQADLAAPWDTWQHWAHGDLEADGSIDGEVRLRLSPHPSFRSTAYRMLFRDIITLKSHLSLGVDRSTTLSNITLKGHAFSSSGNLAITQDGSITEGALALAGDLSRLNPALDKSILGLFEGKLGLSGKISTPLIQGELSSPTIVYGDQKIRNVKVRVNDLLIDKGVTGEVTTEAIIEEIPLTAYSQVSWEPNTGIVFDKLALSAEQSRVDGSVNVLLPSGILTGQVTLQSEDLSLLPGAKASAIQGALEGNITFKADVGAGKDVVQGIEAKLHSDRLAISDLKIGQAHAAVNLRNPWHKPQGRLQLQLVELETPRLSWQELAFATEIGSDDEQWNFSLSSNRGGDNPWEFATEGNWNLHQQSVNLTTMVIALAGQELVLQKPTSIILAASRPQLSPLQLLVYNDQGEQAGSVTGKISSDENNLRVNVAIDALPLAFLRGFDRYLPLAGVAYGSVEIEGTGPVLKGEMQIRLVDLTFTDDGQESTTPLQGILSGSLDEGTFTLQASLDGEQSQFLSLNARLPIDGAARSFEDLLVPGGEIDGHLNVEGSLSQILPFLFVDTHRLDGTTKLSLEASGTVEEPKIVGQMSLENGAYESLRSGTVLKNISCLIESRGPELHLQQLIATDGIGGDIAASGLILIDPWQGFPYNIRADLANTRLLQTDYARVLASGTVELTGNLYEARLRGNLEMEESTLTIPQQLRAGVPKLSYSYINGVPSDSATVEIQRSVDFPLALDLTLNSQNKTVVNGRGLTSQWGGSLELSGTTASPEVAGTMTMREGTFDFANRTFTIAQGSMLFQGDPKDDTILDVTGELDEGDLTIIVLLKGPMTNPKLAFYSNPSLPEREILSRVLFNKSSADITPAEGVQLAQTMVNISGSGSGGDVLGDFRKSIGLDRLDISTSEEDEISLEAGKYISRGVFVSVSKSVNSEASRIAIEAELARRFKVSAETGINSESKVGLKWKRDY